MNDKASTTSDHSTFGSPASTLVGRRLEHSQLRNALGAALDGRGTCILLGGEAGIGKTRLLTELAALGRNAGASPMWGRSWESGGAPPFWLWTQVLRAGVAEFPAAAQHLGTARLLLEPPSAPVLAGDGHQQVLLFDSVARFLRQLSASKPVLLLFDDIHAADADSISLLRFVLREILDTSICIGATQRPSEMGGRHPGDLGRNVMHVPIHGLNDEETAILARRTVVEMDSPVDVDAIPHEFFQALHRATAGNPFFVRETVREIVLTDASFTVPTGADLRVMPDQVREVIRAQLRGLPTQTLQLLRIAAVAGRVFDPRAVRAVTAREQQDEEWVRWLEEARRRGLLGAVSENGSSMAFSHALIREAIYEECAAADRTRWHGEIASALESLWPSASHEHIAEIAHHRLCAGLAGDVDQAVRSTVAAARSGEAVMAYGEAVAYWRSALELATQNRTGRTPTVADEQQRCELMIGLGNALNHSGDRDAARKILLDAMQAARGCDDAEGFARAVLAYGGEMIGTMEVAKANSGPGAVFDDFVAVLLREALDGLGDGRSPLHARLLSRLAVELYFTSSLAERTAMAEQALAIARHANDPSTLGHVLYEILVATWNPDNGEERLRWAREVIRIGQRTGNAAMEAAGRTLAVVMLLEIGDLRALPAESAALARLADRYPLPLPRWQVLLFRGMRALLNGQHEEAERLAGEAALFGHDSATLAFTVQMMELRRQQGRLSEIGESIGYFKAIVDQYPSMLYIRASLTALLVEMGDFEEARRQLDLTAGTDFSSLTRDMTWVAALTRLAEACVALEDRARASHLYELLKPFAGNFSVGTYGGVYWGSVARDLGNLARVLERWDESEQWFDFAEQRTALLGADWWLARTSLDHAEMLCRRIEAGDRRADSLERARRCVVLVEEVSDRAGLASLRDAATRLAARIGTTASSAPATAPAAGHGATDASRAHGISFVREGEYWALGDGLTTVRIKDSRGLRFLATLLDHPGREIHAVELLRLAEGPGEFDPADRDGAQELSSGWGPNDSEALIDPEAKAQYRARVRELRAEIDEAQERRDHGHAAVLQEELDAIAAELRRVMGLGGRTRRSGSVAERARVNVTRAVALALRRIAGLHPELADHLRYEVRTGTFCSYRGPHGRKRFEPQSPGQPA